MERTMIFVNTKREAEFLHDRLNANGFPCRVISGDVEQKKRLKILDDFKSGKLPIMIGTDVASRGLHIEEVSHVINYDLPQDPEDYVHRIGRTARAGAEGKAISFADEDGAFYLEAIEEFAKQKIPTEWAEDDIFIHDYVRTKQKARVMKPAGGGMKGRSAARGDRKPRPAESMPRSATPAARPSEEGAAQGEKKKRRPRRKKPAGEAPVTE
jgi:ATP-dependent RNA helicase RhlB